MMYIFCKCFKTAISFDGIYNTTKTKFEVLETISTKTLVEV